MNIMNYKSALSRLHLITFLASSICLVVTDYEPVWLSVIISFSFFLSACCLLPLLYISAVLVEPTAKNSHPSMCMSVYIFLIVYTIGVFLALMMLMIAFIMSFELKVTKVATGVQVILVLMPTTFAFGYIYTCFYLLRAFVVMVDADVCPDAGDIV